ncbi:MAG: nitroreductase [Rhodothalassiaceae bacterium]
MPYSFPPKGTELSLPPASEEMLSRLLTRRSVMAANLGEPGPQPSQLDQILAAGLRVPDHGKLAPWRFLTFQGTARAAFGTVLAEAFRAANPEAADKLVAFERDRFCRAPTVVAVISSPTVPHAKIPEWEQILSAGAACQMLLLAASALGFSGQWLTEWYAYDARVAAALGLTEQERVAGFVYLGTAQQPPQERDRPALADKVRPWSQPA